MKNLRYILLLLFVFNNFLFAQNIEDEDPTWRADSAAIHEKIDFTFQNLDKTKLTTGYLLDRVPFSILNMVFFDGKKDSTITTAMWWQLYFELKHFAEFTPSALPTSKALENQIDSIKASNIVPLGIINMDYNHFTEDALSSGMLTVQNEQVYENFTPPDSPYGIKRFFAVAKLGTLKVQNSTSFLVDSLFYFSNANGNIIKFEINFGDGAGFHTVHFGDVVNIVYPDTGNILIYTKAIYATDTLQCKTFARVIGTIAAQNKNFTSTPGRCQDFIDAFTDGSYFPPEGLINLSGGRGYIKYGCGNEDKKLRKPFIFVEGIDFGRNCPKCPDETDYIGTDDIRYGDLGWRQIILAKKFVNEPDPFSNGKEDDNPNFNGIPTLANKLCSEGYDLVMLDFKDGADWINDNAMVLVDLIQEVNKQLRDNGSKQQIIVMGVSMGGQVARYALRYMELNGMEHNTRMFISLDSPNSGANIPLGTQFAIRYATFWLPKRLMEQLFREATKQLLIYHHVPTMDANDHAFPYDEHTQLYHFNSYMTDFPEKPYKVAIANGSGFGNTQGYDPGNKTINIVTGRTFEAWALEDDVSEHTVFRGSYSFVAITTALVLLAFFPLLGWLIGLILVAVLVTTTDIDKVQSAMPLDNTSGGYRTTNKDVVEGLISAWGGNVFNYAAEYKKHSFIPTFSAFGLQQTNANVSSAMKDILGATVLPDNKGMQFYDPIHLKTPFDVVYAPVDNLEHVTVNDENVGWVMNEVSPPNLFLQNKSIVSNSPMLGYGYEARNNITIGYNVDPVTNRQLSGNFNVENNATVSMRAGNEIHLVGGPDINGVWFKKGSDVHLFIQPFQCNAVCRMGNPNADNNEGDNSTASTQNWTEISSKEIKKPEIKPTALSNNYPNPFSDHTHIDYIISDSGAVTISVFDISGQKVATLVNTNNHTAGKYTATLDARKLSQGIYYCRMETENYSETKKMILLK